MTVSHGVIPDRAARATRGGLAPLGRWLATIGVSANAITAIGVALTIAGSSLIALERPLAAVGVLVVGSLADTLDGVVARATGGGTRLGAFFDSTADRVADAALLGATAWVGFVHGDAVLFWGALVALCASFLVSYIRARAGSLGANAAVGPAPREARLVILLAGLGAWAVLASVTAFTAAVLAVAVLATVTLIQRTVAVAQILGRS